MKKTHNVNDPHQDQTLLKPILLSPRQIEQLVDGAVAFTRRRMMKEAVSRRFHALTSGLQLIVLVFRSRIIRLGRDVRNWRWNHLEPSVCGTGNLSRRVIAASVTIFVSLLVLGILFLRPPKSGQTNPEGNNTARLIALNTGSNTALDIYFFQYSDFNLSGTASGDSVSIVPFDTHIFSTNGLKMKLGEGQDALEIVEHSISVEPPGGRNTIADVGSEFPKISRQPADEAVRAGSHHVLSVQATNADAFQWYHNGVAMEGQTNSELQLANVGIKDVGLYQCNVVKGEEAVPTRAASLNVFTTSSSGGPITVFGTPVSGGTSTNSCPGAYVGYVSYVKPAPAWGWAPTVGKTIHSATDTNRTDTSIVYLGIDGDGRSVQTAFALSNPSVECKYRFTVYFPNNVPTNAYPIMLEGFDP